VGHSACGRFFWYENWQEDTMSNIVVFRSADEIESVVRRFESCDFAKGEFTHALHLAVAAWYASKYTDEEALTRMRSGLLRLTNKFGVKAYHETITQFWMRISRDFLVSETSGSSLAATVNRFIEAFAAKDVVYQYYSRELLQSDLVKTNWVEPDLKPISSAVSGSM
jgi:hypothetical protein